MVYESIYSVYKLITFQTLMSLAYVPVPLDFRPLAQAGGFAVAVSAKCIAGGALGVVAPVAAFRLVAESRGALAQGSLNVGLVVAGHTHPHGDHGIHSG